MFRKNTATFQKREGLAKFNLRLLEILNDNSKLNKIIEVLKLINSSDFVLDKDFKKYECPNEIRSLVATGMQEILDSNLKIAEVSKLSNELLIRICIDYKVILVL